MPDPRSPQQVLADLLRRKADLRQPAPKTVQDAFAARLAEITAKRDSARDQKPMARRSRPDII